MSTRASLPLCILSVLIASVIAVYPQSQGKLEAFPAYFAEKSQQENLTFSLGLRSLVGCYWLCVAKYLKDFSAH